MELIYRDHGQGSWTFFKEGWEAKDANLYFTRSGVNRRVVLVRRRIYKDSEVLLEDSSKPVQQSLAFIEKPEDLKLYEYSVLITNLDSDLVSIVQHYRDRADNENVFDELKNQWGWGGYTTRDIKTSRFMSRIIALINNWWNLFVRLANPDNYQEAITSRPLLLAGVGRLTHSGSQKRITITSQHGWSRKAREYLTRLNCYFSSWKSIAPQLNCRECWHNILKPILDKYSDSLPIGPPKHVLTG